MTGGNGKWLVDFLGKQILNNRSVFLIYAGMMELVDMRDLGSRAAMRWGSSPHARTNLSRLLLILLFIGDDLYAI